MDESAGRNKIVLVGDKAIMEIKYNAGLMAQSFWFIEFKKVVQLYYDGADYDEIKRQCIEENLLGAVNPTRELRMAGYLLTRLRSMDDELVEQFMKSDVSTQKIINLITLMRTNRLFFEYVYEVYRNKLLTGEETIGISDGNIFFAQKESQNDDLASWKESTKKTLRSLYLNFLTEAGMVKLVEGEKERRVSRVFVNPQLENYLKTTNISMYKAIMGVC